MLPECSFFVVLRFRTTAAEKKERFFVPSLLAVNYLQMTSFKENDITPKEESNMPTLATAESNLALKFPV